jgi:hypothetical protein
MADYLVRSPRQATTVYGLDGSSAPRKKSLFYVRFKRKGVASGWQNNLGFMVKSVDRPSVQPDVQEVNQYNKKRQITTGYKIQPMRMVLYDTADSLAMRMWAEYASWYFGDFAQVDAANWQYDATTAAFNQADNGAGFGFQPRPSTGNSTDDALDLNSSYFFDIIEIYQVFGGQFTQFDLVNPKITAFDPDELDYSVTEPATITISFAYEALLYRNNGQPMSISTNADVSQAFNEQFDGDTFDVPGAARNIYPQPSTPTVSPMPLNDFRSNLLAAPNNLSPNSGNVLGGGSLAQFGAYNFGSLSPGVSLGGGTAADVSYLSTGNNSLSTLLNMPVGSTLISNPESIALSGSPNGAPSALSAATLDATQGILRGGGGGSNPYATSYIDSNLIGGVAASGLLSGTSATDQAFSDGSGLSLSPQSYGVINAQRPAYSQIGLNQNSSASGSAQDQIQTQLQNQNDVVTALQNTIAQKQLQLDSMEDDYSSGGSSDTTLAADILNVSEEITNYNGDLADAQVTQFTLQQQLASAQATT